MTERQQEWKVAGLTILPVRFVQGWIFWGGGSRRFIYDPSKLDPHASQWMANKLQSAMPGAILGVNHAISFLLNHFYLLYASIIIFSLIELLSGLGLILGFCTRLAGFATMLISITLMLAFGWQGATCMDEWTMAAATFAMGFTLTLSGAAIYSLDHVLTLKYPHFAQSRLFRLCASGPLPFEKFKKIALLFLTMTIGFTLLTYNYYRGSIFSAYHSGPVSAATHHIAITNMHINSDGTVKFTLYVDGGTPALPANIIRIEIIDEKNQVLMDWQGAALSLLAPTNIHNDYDYNRVHPGEYGLVAPLSAKANVTLTGKKLMHLNGNYQLVIYTINGSRFESAPVSIP